MTKMFSKLMGLMLCLFSVAVFAQESDKNSLLDTLMKKSGISKQVSYFPAHIQAGMKQAQAQQSKLTPTEMAKLNALMVSSFNVNTILADIKNHLGAKMTSAEIRTILTWLDSPLGKRITQLEEKASTPEAQVQSAAQYPKLQKQTDRLNQMNRIDLATKATDGAVALMQNLGVAMAVAMTANAPAGVAVSVDEIQASMQQNAPNIKAAMQPQVIASFLYTYRSLRTEELNKYIAFAESASGQKYHATAMDALSLAMNNAAKKLGAEIGHTRAIKQPA